MGTAIIDENAAIKVFKALELATLFTGPAGVLLGVAAGIAGVTAAVVGFVEATRDGGPAVRELTEAARELNEAIEEAGATCEDTTASTLAAADVANSYIDKLEAMGDMANASDKEQKQYQNTLTLLLQVMPELSDCISTTTDEYGRATYTLETTTEALRANTEEWKRNAKAQAYQEYLNTLMEQYNGVMLEAAENEIGLTQARYELEAASQKYNAAIERMNELWAEASEEADRQYREYGVLGDATGYLSQEYYDLQNSLSDLSNEVWEAQSSVEAHEKAVAKDAEAVAAAEAEMNAAEQAVNELTEAMGDYSDGQANTAAQESAVREALDGTMASVQALTEAYADAYDEALESFSGQFGLFDEAKADAEATVAAAQEALNTQLSFWQGYAANIAVLKEQSAGSLHVTEENYNALMEYVRSGTPEAAGLAADMVKAVNDGNTQALTDLANTLGEISESQEEAAGDVAEWTTGLNEQMDQLIRDMKEEIGKLDMSEEAKESGRATVQAYIDQAEGMLPQVRSAYANVARAASLALGPAKYADSAWYANGGRGYASGTANAVPGWSWVGEEGPELMRMHGGEQILPSSVSREVAEDYNAYTRYTAAQGVQSARPPLEVTGTSGAAAGRPKIDLHLHIEAGASPETVNAWQDYVSRGELKSAVLEVMEDADADMRRRAMV